MSYSLYVHWFDLSMVADIVIFSFRLVFSQSLLALDMIEDFLALINDGSLELPQPEDPLPLPYKRWRKDQDYLRLDGSTNAETRKTQCKFFNSQSNDR